MPLTLVRFPPDRPEDGTALDTVLDLVRTGREVEFRQDGNLEGLRNRRLLFAFSLGDSGLNFSALRSLARLRQEPDLLEGSTAGILIHGNSDLYTKSAATEFALALNRAGCALLGRPLVEATGSLTNFRVQAANLGTDLPGAWRAAALELADRLEQEIFPRRKGRPELLVLHASTRRTSNTLDLWSQTARHLEDRFRITEMGLRNGTLSDCSGCPYTMCLHFGEHGGCFYGGVMQEEVYPAVRRCDGLVLLCPNYNDALAANLTAFINRLTALFRQTRFYDKALFAIVVSGYSGSDLLARQLIGAMNMNKSFYLPARFALLETANNPGEALALPGIAGRTETLARRIADTLLSGQT